MRKLKSLGQHFLNDEGIAQDIVEALKIGEEHPTIVVEVGPGAGVLTKYLVKIPDIDFRIIEIDRRLPELLIEAFPSLDGRIINGDVLKVDFEQKFANKVSIIGNFPYNISSQILFKILAHKDQVPQMVGMFQREVAQRIAAGPSCKQRGILSILIQIYYKVEYLFEVGPHFFDPPPKVQSAVIRLERISDYEGQVDFEQLRKVVKKGFGQRRKKLSNALKGFEFDETQIPNDMMSRRAEELSIEEFILLTNAYQQG